MFNINRYLGYFYINYNRFDQDEFNNRYKK